MVAPGRIPRVLVGTWCVFCLHRAYFGRSEFEEWVVLPDKYVIEVFIYKLSEARHSWKSWSLPSEVHSSCWRLGLRHVVRADGLNDLQRFSTLYHSIDCETVPLMQIQEAGFQTMQSASQMSANGAFFWFDLVVAVTTTFEAAHRPQKQGFPATSKKSGWKTVPTTLYFFDYCFNRSFDVSSPGASLLLSKQVRRESIGSQSLELQHFASSRSGSLLWPPLAMTVVETPADKELDTTIQDPRSNFPYLPMHLS